MNAQKAGIRFAPSMQESLKDAVISNVRVRGMNLTVEVNGCGSKIEKFLVDGAECEPFLAWDEKEHKVTIYLA